MRNFVISCLLASASTPLLAQLETENNRVDRPSRDTGANESRAWRGSRSEPATPRNWSRDQVSGSGRRDTSAAGAWRSDRRVGDDRVIRGTENAADWQARRGDRDARNPSPADRNEEFRQRWSRDRRAPQPSDGVWNERLRERSGTSLPRQGSQAPVRVGRNDSRVNHRWSGDWRHDRRYDWRDYRNRNRSRFHLGAYFDPFGWSYQRFNVGWRLWPDYYSSRYWINDPGFYRLPPAYPGTRWVRYHDDALLVDTWSGEVIDVVYAFFW
ncbi:ATP-dependent RNA helicase [Sphingomonas piscis]|uniref:ATP-dependent RNA helicase n=1 Tax=Sphingomonas piscis TaxID=2714943 RepID=A0A6G7YQB9_9SPHN|nr:RcnB family protein [Sphingomonas piscis]QIK78927.1 ATP-dependent RNA helicase [Sphingomonas piscis]